MSLYTIDGGSPVTFTPNRAGSTLYQQLFFQSPVLHEGSHTLAVTFLTVENSDMLFLDFFTINEAAVPASSLTTFSSSSSQSSPLSTTTYTTPQSSLSSNDTLLSTASPATPGVTTAPVQGKSKSELLIGPIIGGALGVLILTCIVLLYLRRGRQEHHPNENIGAPPPIGKNSPLIRYLKWLIIPVSCLLSIQIGRDDRYNQAC
jgi:hypothetical protein